MPRKPWYRHLYFQVIIAIIIGVFIGHFWPAFGASMKPFGDAFIAAIRMVIAPIIFCTVVHGIASMEDMKKVGRVGLKALIYFEVMTTVALIVGMVIANVWRPGAGVHADVSTIDTKSIQTFTTAAQQQGVADYFLHIIPVSAVGAFAEGEVIQVLFFAILFAFALSLLGERGKPLLRLIDIASHTLFGIVAIIMRAAPLGAFGAMAFTIGRYGIGTLVELGQLMASVYLTCLIFIFGVLGIVTRLCGFSILKFVRYIKEELLIVLGTSSSESVLPRMIAKLENLGCQESVVGLVIPTGYSFNLDGTCIYLTMAALFLAQATDTHLSFGHQLGILGVLLLTSKGAAGVTGSGFIVLAATLASTGAIPVASIALILGVDRFMSEARALTNLIGNGVATVVVAKWENALDVRRLHAQLEGEAEVDAEEPESVLPGPEPLVPQATRGSG
ncbi:MAG: dicarboxylate/amino acid:cation symporter [Acetobacteraceae bacterium]|nr:dicarboxylate/amino acid:cation symporter [Acetobacteraceae bacterium]MBV8523531.1 dicarboxylate/amino acid:cation symporter [Acetobacteraceae bacterium]MBV8591850.1 dicarboxylate/amino acid:cation symporter [Acetobacteraceae bacterium]